MADVQVDSADSPRDKPVNRLRRATSSPSGRSASPISAMSDSSRRRIEEDAVKEPARSVSPKFRRRKRSRTPKSDSKSRSRSRSTSPKHKKRASLRKSRSRSTSRSRRRSRSREPDSDRRGDRNGHRNGGGRRSRSPRYRSRRQQERRRFNETKFLQDNPKPSRCVGVFGLSTRTREKDLRSEFERYGQLENIQLIHDHKSGRSRGFGFIYFTYLEDAQKARDAANGMILDDRKIRVDFSLTDRMKSPPRRIKRSRSHSVDRRRRSGSRS